MDETRDLVRRAACGDEADRLAAFGELVRRHQDMAYGYAWSILADFHLAEDAAQDAFVTAYGRLAQLRDPEAFAGWFRRIVHSACHRILRRSRRENAPLEAAATRATEGDAPDVRAEANERRSEVTAAIEALPEPQREVTTLFYIDGYSQRDVADFLEIPVTTVNNRLHASRERLRERMLTMVADELKKRPLSSGFPERIRMLLELPRPLEEPGHPVRELWDAFRAAFPDHEVVELDEVCDPAIWLEAPRHPHGAFVIDDRRMLRTELRSQLLDRWLAQGGPFGTEWVGKGGLDPSRYGAIGFAFGLERTAVVKLGLDDVRQVGA